MKIKEVLQAIDKRLNQIQPNTMDEFIEVVHNTEGIQNYGSSFSIVQYMGATMGVRVSISGRTKNHILPAQKGFSYGVYKGLEKYIQSGTRIELPDGQPI